MPRRRLGARIPTDFLDELIDELEASQQAVACQAERLAILAELQQVAAAASRRLGRPVTVFDVVDTAQELTERDRLAELVRSLRRID
jgi:hypothetical protein